MVPTVPWRNKLWDQGLGRASRVNRQGLSAYEWTARLIEAGRLVWSWLHESVAWTVAELRKDEPSLANATHGASSIIQCRNSQKDVRMRTSLGPSTPLWCELIDNSRPAHA
jgi:hypothetical protein